MNAPASRARRAKASSKRASIHGQAPRQRAAARIAPWVAMADYGMDSIPPMKSSELRDLLRIMSDSFLGHALLAASSALITSSLSTWHSFDLAPCLTCSNLPQCGSITYERAFDNLPAHVSPYCG